MVSAHTLMATVTLALVPACTGLATRVVMPRSSISMVGRPAAEATVTRRSALAVLATAPAALLLSPEAARAGDSKANRLLVSLGFPPLPDTKGYFQLAEFVGRTGAANIDGQKTRGFNLQSPLLVAFNYPQTWVTALPTTSSNGESGTVSAGNYIKGDSASFVSVPVSAKKASDIKKDKLAESVVTSATGDVYQDVKVSKITPRDDDYIQWEYTYTLLTRAGFEVDRRGVAAGAIVNGQLAAMITATTSQRWKSEQDKLKELCQSFHAYPVKKQVAQNMDLDD